MATQCEKCGQSFKGQNGLIWHLHHIHSINPDNAENEDVVKPTNFSEPSDFNDNARLDELELKIQRLVAVVAHLEEANENKNEKLSETLSEVIGLKSRIVEFERALNIIHTGLQESKTKSPKASEEKGFLSFPIQFFESR